MTQCYLLCNRKTEIMREFPVAGIPGVPECGTGNLRAVHSGRRLLLAETRAELEQCLCLAPLNSCASQTVTSSAVRDLLLLLSELCFNSKKLVWVEAGGLYCSVWYNFAGEIHGLTCPPQGAYRCLQLPTLMCVTETKCLHEPWIRFSI